MGGDQATRKNHPGGITFPELVEGFTAQAAGLLEGGADLFAVETCQDTRNTKAALIAVDSDDFDLK